MSESGFSSIFTVQNAKVPDIYFISLLKINRYAITENKKTMYLHNSICNMTSELLYRFHWNLDFRWYLIHVKYLYNCRHNINLYCMSCSTKIYFLWNVVHHHHWCSLIHLSIHYNKTLICNLRHFIRCITCASMYTS